MKISRRYILLIAVLLGFSSNAQDNGTSGKLQDTLFFELDENYFQKGRYNDNLLYIKDALKDKGSSETFLFKVVEKINDIAPSKNIQNLEQYIRSSGFFNEAKKVNKLSDYRLASHLQNFVIYLVNFNCEPPNFFRVYPLTQIE